MSTRDATPATPRKPDINEVKILIGTWIPNDAPNIFKKNKNSAPIANLTAPLAIHLTGLNDAPANKVISTNTITVDMMAVCDKTSPPLSLF